jgi:hypothetical protein
MLALDAGEREAKPRFSLNVAISSLQITQAPPNIVGHSGAGGVIASFDAPTVRLTSARLLRGAATEAQAVPAAQKVCCDARPVVGNDRLEPGASYILLR